MIKLTFNNLGVLVDTEVDPIRQGDKGVDVVAIFEDKNNANYLARLNFTRADGKMNKNVTMNPSSTDSETYTKKLDSLWYFEKHGENTLSIYLVDGQGNQVANGQVTLSVERTDYTDETSITPEEYEELLELIAEKLNITDGIIKADSIVSLGNLDQYEVGQVFYIKNNADSKLWQWNGGVSLELLFDFNEIKSHKVESINLTISRNASNNVVNLQLIGDNGLAIATAIATLQPASNLQAGLMQSTDKAKLLACITSIEAYQIFETKVDASASHNDLQAQIDAIESKSDVVDVVGTHEELEEYDTSKLGDNDIIKVLNDEEEDGAIAYYRYDKETDSFELISAIGPYYTKGETDTNFLKKVDAETKYQHKVIYSDTQPQNPQDNDIWVKEGSAGGITHLYKHTLTCDLPNVSIVFVSTSGTPIEVTAANVANVVKTSPFGVYYHSSSNYYDGPLFYNSDIEELYIMWAGSGTTPTKYSVLINPSDNWEDSVEEL